MEMALVSDSAEAEPTAASRKRGGRWPLVPLAPLLISVVALSAALLIGLLATSNLQSASDAAAVVRSKTLAAAVAARLAAMPPDGRTALLAQVSARSSAGYLLFDSAGKVAAAHGVAAFSPSELGAFAERASGLSESEGRRVMFAVRSLGPPLEHLALVAIVDAPQPAEGTSRLTKAVVVLTLLMLLVAVGVALAFTGATRDDLRLIRQRIAELAAPRLDAREVTLRASTLPLRSFDQVGTLTAALNGLVARFAEAERGYRTDLDAAVHIDAERSEFLAGLSHELRTPLNAILGFSHLLESESDGPLSPDALEALAMIRMSGGHLKSLIDDILDLSAAETGQLRLSRTVVDVHELAEAVVREARVTVGMRPIALVVEGSGPVLAWADGRRVRQILTNLVANALKATAEGQVRVGIAGAPEQHSVNIFVADTGRGIDPAVLGAIFEPYRQVGEESARRGGAGLGLAITRQLVLLHGGTIEAVSSVGHGSAFTVRLPDDSAQTRVPDERVVAWADEPTGPEPARNVLPSLSNEITDRRRAKERL